MSVLKYLPPADELIAEMDNMLMKDIANKYNVSKLTLAKHIKKVYPNYNGRKHFVNKLDHAMLYNELQISTLKQTSKKYKTSQQTVRRIIREFYPGYNMFTGPILYDERFFQKIDTEEKAYWLGFWYADGCVGKYNKANAVKLDLAEIDLEHIKKFQKQINSSHPLYERIKEDSITYSLQIYNKNMMEDLIDKGCLPKKSLILKFPTDKQVPQYLMNHFLRGYFDGDGSIFISKNKQKQAKFVGSLEFIISLKKYLLDNSIIFSNTKLDRNENVYSLRFMNKIDVYRIVSYLYDNATVYLSRKYELYKNFKESLLPANKCCLETCPNKLFEKSFCKKHYTLFEGGF